MKRFIHLFAATAVLLLAGASVRADVVPWTYSWQRSPISIAADGSGTGGVSLTSEALPKQAAGSSDIVATNLRIFSSATASNPDKLVTGGAYTLSLTLTDTTSGTSGTVTFTGKLTGTFSAGSSLITNVFTSPTVETLNLGANKFTVAIGPYSPPGPPSASNAGSIAAHVDVSSLSSGGGPGSGPGTADAPEPSGIVLSCLGLSCLGGAAWRKRLLGMLRK
jgi:hypothetical protein